jgi:hypothetical protein
MTRPLLIVIGVLILIATFCISEVIVTPQQNEQGYLLGCFILLIGGFTGNAKLVTKYTIKGSSPEASPKVTPRTRSQKEQHESKLNAEEKESTEGPEKKFCGNCGKRLQPHDIFCPQCGEKSL